MYVCIFTKKYPRTWTNEWGFHPFHFINGNLLLQDQGWKNVEGCVLSLIETCCSRKGLEHPTQEPLLGTQGQDQTPGVGGEPLGEDWWGRVNAEGMLTLVLVLNLASWHSNQIQCSIHFLWRLAWWLRGRESGCNAGGPGFNPWAGKTPWRRERLPTPVFLPGESHGQRSLAGNSSWGCKESDTT